MGRNHRRKRKYKFNQRERAAMARANVALRAYQPWRLLDVRDVPPVGWVVLVLGFALLLTLILKIVGA